MIFGLYLRKDMEEALTGSGIGTDDEGGPLHPFYKLSVHVLGFEKVVTPDHNHVGVGEKIVGQVVLSLKVLLGFYIVARDTEDNGSGLLEFAESIAETTSFDGTARSVGPGIEEEHHGPIGEIGKVNGLSVLVLKSEIFDFIVDLHTILYEFLMDNSFFCDKPGQEAESASIVLLREAGSSTLSIDWLRSI